MYIRLQLAQPQPLFPASSKRRNVFPPHQSITHGFPAVNIYLICYPTCCMYAYKT